jgi:hypothetical protein
MIYFYHYLLIPLTLQTFPLRSYNIYYDINRVIMYRKQKIFLKL